MCNLISLMVVFTGRKESPMNVSFDVVSLRNATSLVSGYDTLLRQLHGTSWSLSYEQIKECLLEIANRPNSELVLLLFSETGTLIGSAQATYAFCPPKPKVYINSVILDRDYRGENLGALIMEELHTKAQAKWPHARSFELTSAPKRNTEGFYTKLGYGMRTKEAGDETVVYVKKV